MNERSSAAARAFAAAALIAGFLIVIVVVAGSVGGDDNGGSGNGAAATQTSSGGEGRGEGSAKQGKRSTFYVVQNGDTLTSIARKTGVSVDRIEALNPGVDPQILVSGEKLKLR